MSWQQCLKFHQDTEHPSQEVLALQHIYLPAVRNIKGFCSILTFAEICSSVFPWGQNLGGRFCDSSFCTCDVFLHLDWFSSLKLQKCGCFFLGTILLAFKLLGTRKHRLWWEYDCFFIESYFMMQTVVLKIITVGHLHPSCAEFLVRQQHQRQICAHPKCTNRNPGVSQAPGAVAIELSGVRILPSITFILP